MNAHERTRQPSLGSLAAARSAAAWAALCRAEPPPDDREVEAAWRAFDAEARRRRPAGAALGAYLPSHERESAAQLLAADRARIATALAEVVEAVSAGLDPAHGARALVALAEAEGVDIEQPLADLLAAAQAAGWALAEAEAAVAAAVAGGA
jgi:hypothetical protein